MTKKRVSSFETGKVFFDDITKKVSTFAFYPWTGALPQDGREECWRYFQGYNGETAVRVSSGVEFPVGSLIAYAAYTPAVQYFLDLFYKGYFFDMFKAMDNIEVLCFLAGAYMAVEGAIRLGFAFDNKEHDYKLYGSLLVSGIYYSIKSIKSKWDEAKTVASKSKKFSSRTKKKENNGEIPINLLESLKKL